MAEVQTLHIVVHGKVQGVGFRNFATLCANNLNICGWTRNLVTSEVEILVQGPAVQLEVFLDQIKRGPARSNVTKLDIVQVYKAQKYENFSRRVDGEKKDEF